MKYLIIVSLLAILGFNSSKAQSPNAPDKAEGLKPGKQVPNIMFKNVLNYEKSSNSKDTSLLLSTFTGKAIILDFWATWCTTCIHHFKDGDSLGKVYNKELQFILINTSGRDKDSSKVRRFIKAYIAGNPGFSLPFVMQDKSYSTLFPSYALPHYVWIGADGQIKAITGYEELTDMNIKKLIKGLPIHLKLKEW